MERERRGQGGRPRAGRRAERGAALIVVSFVLVYAVERHRLKEASKAAHIAMGAVVSRVAVILLKVGATLGMSAWLLVHLFLGLCL